MLGDSHTVYASTDNLYLSAQKSEYEQKKEFGYTVSTGHDYTRVTRLSMKDGEVEVEASADVPGMVDDQFSLEEKDGTLRIVTTDSGYVDVTTDGPGGWSYSEERYDRDGEPVDDGDEADDARDPVAIEKKYGKLQWIDEGKGNEYGYGNTRSTGLYVLDMDLEVIGKVENLAPDESVYSCRYIGDVAYFVTFRNTDPLFSVDLSDPAKPKVMGKLKIPGFSEYLHPYADGLLFGLGSDADENTGAVKGVKVSMFDNSDPFDVTEKDKLVFDDLYYTQAANNHKAVLIDRNKSLVAFPADEKYVILKYDEGEGFKRVMDVSLDPPDTGWYGGLRGLFIGDMFYVIAPDSIHAYDMTDDFESVDSVSLGDDATYVDQYSYTLPEGYEVPNMPIRGLSIE
jgi:uncharacterized secreted protein with C-terminal beta-propeller domain